MAPKRFSLAITKWAQNTTRSPYSQKVEFESRELRTPALEPHCVFRKLNQRFPLNYPSKPNRIQAKIGRRDDGLSSNVKPTHRRSEMLNPESINSLTIAIWNKTILLPHLLHKLIIVHNIHVVLPNLVLDRMVGRDLQGCHSSGGDSHTCYRSPGRLPR